MTSTAWSGRAWSCDVRLVVGDPRALRAAAADLVSLLDRVDAAASRFRADSALAVANARAGRPTPVPQLLVDLVDAALDAAGRTCGAVDPTLGATLAGLGYDRDIAEIRGRDVATGREVAPRTGAWRAVRLDRRFGLLTVPARTALDLGATAKAWTADHAARTLAARYGTGVLVELGGDVAVAGARPGGWTVRVAEQPGSGRDADGVPSQVITLHSGGLTTSTTTLRTWRRGAAPLHHIVDPTTGRPADGPWRTATVAAGSALDANVASTAAVVLGDAALGWLASRGYPARLVGRDGQIVTTAGWPGHGPDPDRPVQGVRPTGPTAVVVRTTTVRTGVGR